MVPTAIANDFSNDPQINNLLFTNKSLGWLQARLHPQSPVECGIDVIEIGAENPDTHEFTAHLALLQDRFDESYPGIAPTIRTIYSYALDPTLPETQDIQMGDSTLAPPKEVPLEERSAKHPVEITKPQSVKKNILTYVSLKLAIMALGMNGPVYGVFSEFLNSILEQYRRTLSFYRTQALYEIELMITSRNSSLLELASPDTLYDALAITREHSARGLLMPAELRSLVIEYQENQKNENRTISYTHLLSILNREGLLAFPLLRDFVLVYYDPKRDYGRPIDLGYTDISGGIEGSEGLVPLGIYAIGQSHDRVLMADLTETNKTQNRYWIQTLTNYAVSTGNVFIPFPYSFLLTESKSGLKWVLEKQGNNLFTDTIHSEAELIVLLQSGMVQLDSGLIKRIRSEIATPDNKLPDYNHLYHYNAKLMTEYLSHNGNKICKKIKKQRNKEFQKEYLSLKERLHQKWIQFWQQITHQSDPTTTAQERKQIIQERHRLIAAQTLVEYYDESRISSPLPELIAALQLLSQTRESKNGELIARILQRTVHLEVEKAALEAMGSHGSFRLVKPLCEYLQKNGISGFYNGDLILTALHALEKLKIEESINSNYYFHKIIKTIDQINTTERQELTFEVQRIRDQLIQRKQRAILLTTPSDVGSLQ